MPGSNVRQGSTPAHAVLFSAMAIAPTADDVQPVANERLDRFLTGSITVLPFTVSGSG